MDSKSTKGKIMFFYELSDGERHISDGKRRYWVQDHANWKVFFCEREEGDRWYIFINHGDSKIELVGSYENEQQAKAVAWDRYCWILRKESNVQS